MLTDNQLDVVNGKKGIVYSTIFASKRTCLLFAPLPGNQSTRDQRRGFKSPLPKSQETRCGGVVVSEGGVDATVWESVRNRNCLQFDVCGHGKAM